jgi:hypothetical protein
MLLVVCSIGYSLNNNHTKHYGIITKQQGVHMNDILLLLVAFQLKHFISDYPLQNEYMLGKMKLRGWFVPLLFHASVHALLTLAIVIYIDSSLWWLALVDLIIHFTMDRIKASPNMLNRFGLDNKFFWWSLGLDQMVHHLTHYFIIYMLVRS